MPRHRKERRRQRLRLSLSLIVTPWFAAGTGVLIAAAVAVDSPPALTYGPELHCPAGGCASPGGPALQDAGPHARGAVAASTGAHRAGPAVAATVARVEYQIITPRRRGFVVIITLPGDLKPGSWSLRFGFAAARIDQVRGALWKPSGNGRAGTANAGPGAYRLGVRASGTPSAPSGCRLDGLRCSFRRGE